MIITSSEIRVKFKKLWPKLKFVWLLDGKFWMPSKLKLEDLLLKSKVDRLQYISSIQDCDDMALQLNSEIKRMRAIDAELGNIPRDEWYPYAFGEVLGTQFRGMSYYHAVNICVCKDDIYLVEPQDDRIWKASSDKDSPYFIKM